MALTLAALTACTVPQNMAVSQSPLALASVHRAQVAAIYPIFIPGGLSRERAGLAALSAGELVGDIIFEDASRRSQLSRLVGDAAEAASGVYEERYNGGFCQYFVITTDPQLIKLSKENRDDEELLRDLLRNEVDSLGFESQSLIAAFENAMFDLELSSEALNDFIRSGDDAMTTDDIGFVRAELEDRVRIAREQVDTINELLETNQARLGAIQSRLAAPPEADETMVSVNNPCRNFEIGQEILVSAIPNSGEFALQPVF
ncbi:MAG: hypothetical protein MK180_05510 [Rhodobacteraceae bacterium]|nr:hypothetical protein [Paracoccaceae bacterium]